MINHDIPHAIEKTSKNLVIILFKPLLDSLFKLSLDTDYEILNPNLATKILDVISGKNDENKLGLSKSRISHLFTEEIGISLKQYILWKKLLFAIDSIRSVSDLSQIAIDCGFSDMSHLSRTFKKMFGHTPSSIFKNSSSVQVDFSDSL